MSDEAPVRLRNFTPHPITVDTSGRPLVLEPEGEPVRLPDEPVTEATIHIEGGVVRVVTLERRQSADGLPPPETDVCYIVSRVAAAALDRPDVLFPLGERRDAGGRIVGVRGFGVFGTRR